MSQSRWIRKLRKRDISPSVDSFLEEVLEVCRKHGMSISHEDSQGAFEIVDYSEDAAGWLLEAYDARDVEESK